MPSLASKCYCFLQLHLLLYIVVELSTTWLLLAITWLLLISKSPQRRSALAIADNNESLLFLLFFLLRPRHGSRIVVLVVIALLLTDCLPSSWPDYIWSLVPMSIRMLPTVHSPLFLTVAAAWLFYMAQSSVVLFVASCVHNSLNRKSRQGAAEALSCCES